MPNRYRSVYKVFFEDYEQRLQEMLKGRQFAYYTSATTASHILKKQEVWMRHTSVMNDRSEIIHGYNSLQRALAGDSGRAFYAVFDRVRAGLGRQLAAYFAAHCDKIIENTYLISISEHEPHENHYGRLSMWRTYGEQAGVAIILNANTLLGRQAAIRASLYPVYYMDELGSDESLTASRSMQQLLQQLTERLQRHIDLLKQLGDAEIQRIFFQKTIHLITCTKHPAFAEEKEWRLIYIPELDASRQLPIDVEHIGAIPQKVVKLPLTDASGLAIRQQLQNILIGPTDYPHVIEEALASLLKTRGFTNPNAIIQRTNIPLRPNQR